MSVVDRILSAFGVPAATNHVRALASADRAIEALRQHREDNELLVKAIRDFGSAFPERRE